MSQYSQERLESRIIQGISMGDMDFKVAGTEDGITAFQMDIKIAGVTPELMHQALDQAKKGRMHILGIMGAFESWNDSFQSR